jgi:nucleoside-diphosphate-sugar epimerase
MSTTQLGSTVTPDDRVLITGATGFIGLEVVKNLLDRGFRHVRCLARPSIGLDKLMAFNGNDSTSARVEVFEGNLLSAEDCARATEGVSLIYHLATGRDGKSYPDAFMNAVVTTRNLLEASRRHGCLRRFVNVSSLAVYTNMSKRRRRLLDESSPVETRPELRGEAYCFAKVKQDEIVKEYGDKFGIPYVIVRPGYVIGPGKTAISSRVGIDTFGIFLHLGGSNTVPFTYIDNCADAIVLAGLTEGVNGEVFNVVDDDLPSSRQFLRLYKRNVRRFRSLYVPHLVSRGLCNLWEGYSNWSAGQLPPAFNHRSWHAYWKTTRYSNQKLKTRLGWIPTIPMKEGLTRYFQGCREGLRNA